PNFCNDLLKPGGCNDIVVHENQILLLPVQFTDPVNQTGKGLNVTLVAFKLGDATKATFPDAASRGVAEIGIMDRIAIWNLFKNTVVRGKILNRYTQTIIRVELFRELVELQRNSRRLSKQALDKPNPTPSLLANKAIAH